MLHVVYIETIARHKLRHSQCRSKLTKLGRLQSERSENQPGMRTLDAVRIEYRGKEQQYQHAIDDIREGIEKPVVHHQDNKAHQSSERSTPAGCLLSLIIYKLSTINY